MDIPELKVCGMRNPENIKDLVDVAPDYIGLIFYPKSARYVELEENLVEFNRIPKHIKKVGVFVKETVEILLQKVEKYELDFVQLHGGESAEYCKLINDQGIEIIKVFSVEDQLPIDEILKFEGLVSYFLFDTKTPLFGGSGKVFDWQILANYKLKTPYFLSGGIGPEEMKALDLSKFPGLKAIDINSKVEITPGFKDIDKVKELKQVMNKQEQIL